MRKFFLIAFVLVIVFVILFFYNSNLQSFFFRPRVQPSERGLSFSISPSNEPDPLDVSDMEMVAENLSIPWEIVFLPDGDLLVTERPGTIVRINKDSKAKINISGVRHIGEGGLLGMALHPDFSQNKFVYVYLTSQSRGNLENRVERYVLNGDQLEDRIVILDNIPAAGNHDGGKIEFGPDGKLYITTGDAQSQNLAQNTDSLAGKILRINEDGSIPTDNPFGNLVWSYGHRNPQGLVWDREGRLWSTEHGPSGSQTGNDEVNLIEKATNYGWPLIKGQQQRNGMRGPVVESGSSDTWAPGAVIVLDDNLFFTGLRGQTLYSAQISGNGLVNLRGFFSGEFGRLRALKLGPDGFIYMSTSNTDGRGVPESNDDKIIRLNPSLLE